MRFVVDSSLHIEDVAADATATTAGLAGWDDTDDRFLSWHCVVTPRADGRWSGRVALVADGWTIGAGSGERRVCRYAGPARNAIDANIAPAGDDADIGATLLGRNFLVVRGSDSCPGDPRTEPYQP